MHKGKGWFDNPEAHAKAGKRGGLARMKSLAAIGYARIGKRGGQATARQYGSAFYSQIGKKKRNKG